ncbi:DJ-1/PfpI family protein [Glaciecola siphonariae]|uniref:DJ-1/PfpI family protein n=1 Tax=Glaciecola siphonariae TaxID=521012 RepID=A0ABV9LZM5_9ALTE
MHSLKIGFLIFPGITPLDALGPAQFLARVPGAEVFTIWKNLEVISTDAGFNLVPNTTLNECPQLDVLCVPGGFGTEALMQDEEVLSFIRQQAPKLTYLTAVCTGSLVLGAAGLLKGKKATTHWAWHDKLSALGAVPTKARVVSDGNLMTGGGVTAGIDFGLSLIAKLVGDDAAKLVQLGMEYDPQPPFDSGSPDKASSEDVAFIKKSLIERARKFEQSLTHE